MQAGQTRRQTINGLSAVTTTFRAQTPQGVLQGLAAFIAYDGRVYQFLGYAPADAFGRYEATFGRALGSFAQLTDAKALAVQPNHLRLVTIKEPMTIAEFHRRFPSQIEAEELAVINGVPSPATRVPAGTQLKRVAP
jgi:predicted Zn-dependent protease